MTKEEAKRYYDAIIGNPTNVRATPNEIFENLKKDFRFRHLVIHYSGVDPPDGVDEDDFFDEILETLSD